MKGLWLLWLPLVFLPNMGVGGATAFGTLEISDYLLAPYLVLVAPAAIGTRLRTFGGRLTPTLLAFAGWALVSTLLVRERYGYLDDARVITGALKVGKFLLYGTAGALTARALADRRWRALFPWSLLACGVVVAATLFRFKGVTDELLPGQVMEGYKAKNAVSVLMAILLTYLGGLWGGGYGTPRWREAAVPCLAVMVAGFLLSNGRGGWVGALAGAAYLLARYGLRPRTVVGLAGAAVVLVVAYGVWPEFRDEVDRTVYPDPNAMVESGSGIVGVDDGGRLGIWAHEFNALARSPLFGTGLFHRGGASGIWVDGCHNFFLQMFLETGLPGGLLVLRAVALIWKHAGSPEARDRGPSAPLRGALVAAVVGGMSGEYFYGGTVLLSLLLVYAPLAALAPEPGHSQEMMMC